MKVFLQWFNQEDILKCYIQVSLQLDKKIIDLKAKNVHDKGFHTAHTTKVIYFFFKGGRRLQIIM